MWAPGIAPSQVNEGSFGKQNASGARPWGCTGRRRGCLLWESARCEAVGGSTKPPSSLGNALAVLPAPEGPRDVPGGQGCHPRLTPVPWPPDDHRAGGPRRARAIDVPRGPGAAAGRLREGPPPSPPQPALRPGLISRPAAAGAACSLSAGTASAQPWARAQRRADSLRLPGPWPVGVGSGVCGPGTSQVPSTATQAPGVLSRSHLLQGCN